MIGAVSPEAEDMDQLRMVVSPAQRGRSAVGR